MKVGVEEGKVERHFVRGIAIVNRIGGTAKGKVNSTGLPRNRVVNGRGTISGVTVCWSDSGAVRISVSSGMARQQGAKR